MLWVVVSAAVVLLLVVGYLLLRPHSQPAATPAPAKVSTTQAKPPVKHATAVVASKPQPGTTPYGPAGTQFTVAFTKTPTHRYTAASEAGLGTTQTNTYVVSPKPSLAFASNTVPPPDSFMVQTLRFAKSSEASEFVSDMTRLQGMMPTFLDGHTAYTLTSTEKAFADGSNSPDPSARESMVVSSSGRYVVIVATITKTDQVSTAFVNSFRFTGK